MQQKKHAERNGKCVSLMATPFKGIPLDDSMRRRPCRRHHDLLRTSLPLFLRRLLRHLPASRLFLEVSLKNTCAQYATPSGRTLERRVPMVIMGQYIGGVNAVLHALIIIWGRWDLDVDMMSSREMPGDGQLGRSSYPALFSGTSLTVGLSAQPGCRLVCTLDACMYVPLCRRYEVRSSCPVPMLMSSSSACEGGYDALSLPRLAPRHKPAA